MEKGRDWGLGRSGEGSGSGEEMTDTQRKRGRDREKEREREREREMYTMNVIPFFSSWTGLNVPSSSNNKEYGIFLAPGM